MLWGVVCTEDEALLQETGTPGVPQTSQVGGG